MKELKVKKEPLFFINLVNKIIESNVEKIEEEKKALDKNIEITLKFQKKLVELIPNLINILEIEGLELDFLYQIINTPFVNGDIRNKNHFNENSQLHISIHAEPTSKKFKFLVDRGYTARGSGKNQPQLNEKAEKLEEKIKSALGIDSVHVNPFSLEVAKVGDTGTVLIELWIK